MLKIELLIITHQKVSGAKTPKTFSPPGSLETFIFMSVIASTSFNIYGTLMIYSKAQLHLGPKHT